MACQSGYTVIRTRLSESITHGLDKGAVSVDEEGGVGYKAPDAADPDEECNQADSKASVSECVFVDEEDVKSVESVKEEAAFSHLTTGLVEKMMTV